MTCSILTRQGVAAVLLGALAVACSSGETSRPGFPRSELTPVAEAPLPYATAEEVGLDPQRLWRFKERLYARVVARHLVGAEILVVRNGFVVLHQSMGWADIDRQVPLNRGSIFSIASMTKPVMGTVALQLIQSGAIDLDDRVSNYLPSFDNPHSRVITVRQLLTHRSGFVQGAEPDGYAAAETLREAVSLVGARGPDGRPGDRFVYSNLNSEVLGALVESVAQMPVEQLFAASVLEPLGMRDTYTSFTPDASWAARVPSLYRSWSEGRWERHWNPLRPHEANWFSPAGGLYSTTFDYARFLQAILDDELLDPSTTALAVADPAAETRASPVSRWYGMHWEIYRQPDPAGGEGLPVFGHRGASGTVGLLIPESRTIVVYLTNSRENEVVEEVIAEALQLFTEPLLQTGSVDDEPD